MANECYVYIMASRSLTLLIGMTNDVRRPAREHFDFAALITHL